MLPPKLIISTFNNLKEVVTQDFGQRFDRLFDYYERFWIKTIKPRGFSVYNLREDKTDNYEESYNRNLNDLLKKNPHPNQFIGNDNFWFVKKHSKDLTLIIKKKKKKRSKANSC